MPALRIFGNDPAAQPAPRKTFADDIVGRFRSGYQVHGRPQALTAWRVTSDDPAVAEAIADRFGGEAQEWDARGDDNMEVFTSAQKVDIIIESPKAIRQRMVIWSRSGKLVFDSDGAVQADGTPDPDADLTFAERKAKARDGLGPEPSISILFRLADAPDLGVFRFQTGSWSMAQDLARDGIDDALEEINGPARATLELEAVSFVAKSGPRAGSTVSYTKPRLKIKGAAKVETETPW